jgi:hypothetical protein
MKDLLNDQEAFATRVRTRAKALAHWGVPHRVSKPMQPGEGARLRADGVLDPVRWTLREILLITPVVWAGDNGS